MKEDEITHKPHVGPGPVKAQPNTDREKTFEPANSPEELRREREKSPIRKAEDETDKEISAAAEQVQLNRSKRSFSVLARFGGERSLKTALPSLVSYFPV